MAEPNKEAFLAAWPKCFLIFMGIIEVLATIILILTELGNVAANFWTTNVFAGGWCGILMLAHFIAIFVTVCCAPGPPAGLRAAVVTVIALIACAALISFDAVFIAQPSTCILTPSCATNAASNSTFSYTLQQSFLTLFRTLGPFSSYTQSQAKFLFQTIQIGVGSLCFILCIIYLVIYYVVKNKATNQVASSRPAQPSRFVAPQQQRQSNAYPQSYPTPYGGGQARVPQQPPGVAPWNAGGRY